MKAQARGRRDAIMDTGWFVGQARVVTERVPASRVRVLEERPVAERGAYVLLWMVAQRRTHHNFALQHAAWYADRLGKPLLVLEPLRVGYEHASDRLHRFVLDGMADNARALAAAGVRYLPFVERSPGAGRGLLAALAERACVVVSDEYPSFFIPRMQAAAARTISARLELVDGCGVVPLQASTAAWTTAHAFRRFIQRDAYVHLLERPLADPLARLDRASKPKLPAEISQRWPCLTAAELRDPSRLLASLPIDHAVRPSVIRGGPEAGRRTLQAFVRDKLDDYAEGRNHPDQDAASGLSPYLHFGHVGAHQALAAVLAREGWDPSKLGDYRVTQGGREGWWGTSSNAEAFLDQLVTWRELGFQFCWHTPDYRDYGSLPAWARTTLAEHRGDPRPELYTLAQLEAGQTADVVWNAAQHQLVGEGRMHNYLRMLWGKKLLEWSPTPEQALARMILLNDKYALDGRDPNSYSGIFWVLGRFDRAWGPERPIFGKIRYMSSDNTRRKLELRAYLDRWG
jgi:deoxyribodipyrimidine photo-lyase